MALWAQRRHAATPRSKGRENFGTTKLGSVAAIAAIVIAMATLASSQLSTRRYASSDDAPVDATVSSPAGLASEGVGSEKVTVPEDHVHLQIDSPSYKAAAYPASMPGAAERPALFGNLEPGRHRSRGTASEDGIWDILGEAQDLEIQPSLVQGLPLQIKCEFIILAMLWLISFLRLRMIVSRLRMAAASARLNERERIARELHDTLLQGFYGLVLRLQAVAECVKSEPEQAHKLIEQALVRADAVLEEGRDRVIDLRTIDKSPCDFSQIFLRVAEDARPHPTKIRVTVEGSMRELQPIVREEAEKIGIEAMNNALRHANASTVHVGIIFQHRRFVLRISDDGIGIDPAILNASRERHFGLTGMRERARGIRGHISIASGRGRGTEIELVIPAHIAYVGTRQAPPRNAPRA